MTNLITETTFSNERHAVRGQNTAENSDDRRVFPRYPIASKLAVQLRVLPATDVIPAQIHDLSREGIGLLTKSFIAPGESISFPVGTDWVVAEVRHCRTQPEGFLVGGVITDVVYENEPAN
jgi:hypothetical protein